MFDGPSRADFRRDISRDMRYVIAGLDSLSTEAWAQLYQLGSIESMLRDMAQTQQALLQVLMSPRATAAAESIRKGAIHAGRGMWSEAFTEYDLAVNTDSTQAAAYFGRGLAELALLGDEHDEQRLREAADSFKNAARYSHDEPGSAVTAVQYAVVCYDRLGRSGDSESLLIWACDEFQGSVELAFSTALRLRDERLLRHAIDLDPTLAADTAWTLLPFTAQVCGELLQHQNQALETAFAALWEAAELAEVSADTFPGPAPDCAAAFARLQAVRPLLDQSHNLLMVSGGKENELGADLTRAQARVRDIGIKRHRLQSGDGFWMGEYILFSVAFAVVATIVADLTIFGGKTGTANIQLAGLTLLLSFIAPVAAVAALHGARSSYLTSRQDGIAREATGLKTQHDEVAQARLRANSQVVHAQMRVATLTMRSSQAYPAPAVLLPCLER